MLIAFAEDNGHVLHDTVESKNTHDELRITS